MFMNGKELKMEIKQLEYFAAAVEYGSLNRAAENMLRRWQKYAGDRNDLCRSRRKEDWVAGNKRRRTETSANTYLRGKGRTYDDDISGSPWSGIYRRAGAFRAFQRA